MDEDDHPELNGSALLDAARTKEHQSLIGALQLCVTLSRINAMFSVMIASRFCMGPRWWHLDCLAKILGCLRKCPETKIRFRCGFSDCEVCYPMPILIRCIQFMERWGNPSSMWCQSQKERLWESWHFVTLSWLLAKFQAMPLLVSQCLLTRHPLIGVQSHRSLLRQLFMMLNLVLAELELRWLWMFKPLQELWEHHLMDQLGHLETTSQQSLHPLFSILSWARDTTFYPITKSSWLWHIRQWSFVMPGFIKTLQTSWLSFWDLSNSDPSSFLSFLSQEPQWSTSKFVCAILCGERWVKSWIIHRSGAQDLAWLFGHIES